MTRRLSNAEDAARHLGLFNAAGKPLKSWVLAEARANRIPHVRLGRYVQFDLDDLDRWIEARKAGPLVDRDGRGVIDVSFDKRAA